MILRRTNRGDLLVNLRTGTCHQLNSSGTVVWEELASPASISNLTDRVRSRIGSGPDLQSDLKEFLTLLEDRGLITTRERPSQNGPPPGGAPQLHEVRPIDAS